MAAGVRLYNVWGTTEVGIPSTIIEPDDSEGLESDVKTSADWAYFTFTDRYKFRWIPEGDGSYEMQVLVSPTLLHKQIHTKHAH